MSLVLVKGNGLANAAHFLVHFIFLWENFIIWGIFCNRHILLAKEVPIQKDATHGRRVRKKYDFPLSGVA